MNWLGAWRRLDANQLSGLGTALGVALAQTLVAALFGVDAGLTAVAGAVCTSLMDLPNSVQRALPRMLPAVAATALATLLVCLCKEHAGLMLVLVAVITFCSLMCMAWGQRAGPLSFTAILALVFTLAWREPFSVAQSFEHAAWALLGALLYTAWGLLLARLLRGRYAELALAGALTMGAQRLRSRADRVEGSVTPEQATMRASIVDDVQLAEAIQHARDLVFALPRDARALRQTEQLLALIELRDMLLASRLDIELLGHDAAGQTWREALAVTLRDLAVRLAALAEHLRVRAPAPAADAPQLRAALHERLTTVPVEDAQDKRRHLVNALEVRLSHMLDEVGRMLAVQQGAPTPLAAAWTPEQLRDFVSPQGWPLAAFRNHLTMRSPVLRHALRSTMALTVAYGLGTLLPWASHPQWLLLSVSVVLRGNLAQTLARRNDRVRGTLLGCLIVMALAWVPQRWLLAGVFVAAVGTSHAYVNKRYFVSATAATLMALAQPLMLLKGTHPAVFERFGDTLFGALLAWAFCFVLPSWERRSLKDLMPLARKVLANHAANVLRWAPGQPEQLAARLSRQQAYAALGALAEASQRTRVEPEHVRLNDAEIEALLTHGYRLMALLGAVHQQLSRRADRLDAARAQAALPVTLRATTQALQAGQDLPVGMRDEEDQHDPQAGAWPEHIGQQDLTPWMLRRLRLIRREARLFNHAAVQLG